VAGSFVFSDVVHLSAWISLGKVRRRMQGLPMVRPYQNALTYGLQSYTDSGSNWGFVAGMGLSRCLISGPVSISEKELALRCISSATRLGSTLLSMIDDDQTTSSRNGQPDLRLYAECHVYRKVRNKGRNCC